MDHLKITYAGVGIAEDHLSLCWNNHRSTFGHVIASLCQKERYSDATIACDGKFYPVHKLILSVCSDYFDAMLDRTPCKHPVIVLRDVDPSDLESILTFMYEGIVDVAQKDFNQLIKTAEMLKIKGLAVRDDEYISSETRRMTTNLNATQAGTIIAPGTPTVVPAIPLSQLRHIRAERGSPQPKRKRKNHNQENLQNSNYANGEHAQNLSQYERAKRVSAKEIKTENLQNVDEAASQHEESLAEKNGTTDGIGKSATIIGTTYGVVVSDGTAHTLVTHPQDPNQVITHRYEANGSITASQSTPLTEAVVEALSSTSGMTSWLTSTGEIVQGEFSTVETYANNNTSDQTQTTQTIVHTMDGSQLSAVTIPSNQTNIVNQPNLTIIETNANQSTSSPIHVQANTKNTPSTSSRGENNPLRCPHCQRSTFRQTSDLKRHIRIHTGEKPFKCPYCPYKASRSDLIQTHTAKMHSVTNSGPLPLIGS